MISFSCKKISKEELIRCSFNLNKTEYNVLIFLLENEGKHTILDISKKMNLERTTIQKAIKNLVKNDLVKRTQINLPKGGYIFYYEINNKKNIKYRMKKIVYNWYKSVEDVINNF